MFPCCTDAFKRCRDKGFIAISTGRLLLNQHTPMIISDFKDNAELVAAAACSSFIPLWSGGTMVTQFRGLPVYDGGFAAQQPCPPGVKMCVRISSSNPVWPKRSSVETFMARMVSKGPVAIVRPDPTIRSYPPITPTGSNGPDPELLKLAASKGVDIAPGGLSNMLIRCCMLMLNGQGGLRGPRGRDCKELCTCAARWRQAGEGLMAM
jgi:hypothetical protein